MNFDVGAAGQLFVLANLAIVAGYLAVPVLVLPFLNLRRRTVAFGAVFFIGCSGSHADMVLDVLFRWNHHPPVTWADAGWHAVQAIGTWGFIVYFRAELWQAEKLLEQISQVESGQEVDGDGAGH